MIGEGPAPETSLVNNIQVNVQTIFVLKPIEFRLFIVLVLEPVRKARMPINYKRYSW